MDKEQKIELLINYINYLFDRLRGDWSDNRGWCRSGWEAVSRLGELMGIDHKPYPQAQKDEQYYTWITEEMTEEPE